jgi:hypothetical protein
MNINTEWNEEPTGPPLPNYGQAIASGFNWLVDQGQGLMSQAATQMPQQTPEENVEDMIRQLRQERARQSYERNFGMSVAGKPSMMAQGQGGQAEAMRQMVMNWNRSGKRNR